MFEKTKFSCLARKKGKKNNSEIGTPIKILFAKVIDFS